MNKKLIDSDNCSTVIIGKNASKTGHVLVGHNEDDMNCVSQVHIVPRMEHKEGEILTFDDGTAALPQVPVTWGYLWSEIRKPGGEPFADGFVNEWGVSLVTDGCVSTKESNQPFTAQLGYGLRRLIIERCKTAREGVLVAAQLMKKYGYRSTRSYHICDKDEAWVMQVTVGNNFVAKRVGDDEVYYIPNWLTIHEVDFSDTEHKNYYWSDDLIGYAERNGWYTPKNKGDYSDFDFAEVYQGEGSVVKSNIDRTEIAWKKLCGKAMPNRTFSVKADRKYGLDDIKEVLRLHSKEYDEDPSLTPHRYYGICRDTTVDSMIVEFNDDKDLTTVWRTTLRPCVSPYIPWFVNIKGTPKGWSWQDIEAAQLTHLRSCDDEMKYHADRAYHAFHMLNMTMEYAYSYACGMVHDEVAAIEKELGIIVPQVRETYLSLRQISPESAKTFLTDFVFSQTQKAWDWANDMTLKVVDKKDHENKTGWRETL